MDLLTYMQNRRSVRAYKPEPIPQEKLDTILQAGLLSESGRNIKPWEFILVTDREILDKLSGARTGGAAMMKEAGAAIVVIADENKTDVWTEDCCIAMAYMHLMADSLGLGSCWVQGRLREASDGRTTEEYVKDLLGIPANYRLEAMLAIGVPKEHPQAHELPDINNEKVHFNRF